MEQQQTSAVESTGKMSALSGVLQVLFKPREVFESLRSKSNWVLPLLIILTIVAVATVIIYPILHTEIVNNLVNKPELTEEQRAQIMEQIGSRITLFWVLVAGLVFQIAAFFIMAAVFFFVGNVLFGGDGKFLGMLSVVGLSLMVAVPETLVKLPMILAKQSMKVHTDLSLFLPGSMEEGFLHTFLGHLDIFSFWKVYLIGLGMAVLYKFSLKKALTATLVVWFLYIVLASVFGKFLGNLGMS